MALKRRARGDGSIFQRKSDGRWCAILTLPAGRRKYFFGASQKAVLDKLTRARRDLQLGQEPTGDRLKLGRFLEDWLKNTAQPKLRPTTFRSYAATVRLYIAPTLGLKALSKLRPDDVRELMAQKLASGLSARSVAYIRAVLRSALHQAEIDGLVARNVAKLAAPPRQVRHEMTPLTVEQAQQLLAATDGDRLEALYALALNLGLRRGELLGLRWQDVDLDAATLQVKQALLELGGKLAWSEPKSATSRRTLPLPPTCVTALKKHRSRQLEERLQAGGKWRASGLVFTTSQGGPLWPRNVSRQYGALLRKAALPRVRFHDLRHTTATLLLAQKVPARTVMEILGHSSISLTLGTYSHVSSAMMGEALGNLGEALVRQARV